MDMEHGGDKYPAFPPDVLWVEIITFSWYILCCIHEQTFRDMKPTIHVGADVSCAVVDTPGRCGLVYSR
jgi:hypothetical protein